MIDLIEHDPLLKKPLLSILHLCEEEGLNERSTLEEAALEQWDEGYMQSPSTCIDILLRNEALVESILVNGEVYEGSLEDIQLDEDVPDDAEVEANIEVTDIGRELLEHYAPEATIAALFEERPQYKVVYQTAIKACAGADGCNRMDLEASIKALPPLQRDPETNRINVYPQYFIDALETAGAIVWNGSWCATEAGLAALESTSEPAS